jgi:hypothetical protein
MATQRLESNIEHVPSIGICSLVDVEDRIGVSLVDDDCTRRTPIITRIKQSHCARVTFSLRRTTPRAGVIMTFACDNTRYGRRSRLSAPMLWRNVAYVYKTAGRIASLCCDERVSQVELETLKPGRVVFCFTAKGVTMMSLVTSDIMMTINGSCLSCPSLDWD